MAVEDDYTEERLAEYDRAAIAQNDVIVMGFVTVVRNLRARAAKLEKVAATARRRVACTIVGGPDWTDADDDAMQDAVDELDGRERT